MADESLKKFGEELKSLREKKAISLNEIHDKTRIDAKYLSEIENGNFDVLPEVYIRAFLRKYANMIEVDEEEIISKYEIAKGEGSEEVDQRKLKKIELDKVPDEKSPGTYDDLEDEVPEKQEETTDDKNKNVVLLGTFVLISLIVLIIYFFFFSNSSEEIIIEKPINEIVSEKTEVLSEPNANVTEKRFESKPQTKTSVPITVSHDSLNLRINAIDTAWMRVTIDNKFGDEFTLNPRLSKTLKAKTNFKLLIGNAGGVELYLNGKKLPKFGKKGEIKNISVDSKGIHYMRIKKP
ncbi:hypothetical protein MNBD_IGNAVI01-441 [hydrothermal vent metagenome]|uniref:Cytoskeleton protein RodZ-like C-terminal domain-containing protein n=1 Tax=hydrothermal vent metagenome TaxID=652676 RepID=A0A3B1CFV1_9ZZZZ